MAESLGRHLAWIVLNQIPLWVFGLVILTFRPEFDLIGLLFMSFVGFSVATVFELVKTVFHMMRKDM